MPLNRAYAPESGPYRACDSLTAIREQRYALMHGLEVSRHKVGIAPGHFERTVAQYLLEMEHGTAAPEIEHSERMPEAVERSGGWHESKVLAQEFDAA